VEGIKPAFRYGVQIKYLHGRKQNSSENYCYNIQNSKYSISGQQSLRALGYFVLL